MLRRRQRLEELVAREQPRTRVSARLVSNESQGQLQFEPEAPDEGFPRLVLSAAVQLESVEQLEQAYVDARARGNEGVMLKARHSTYQPGRRGLAWLKLKRELATLDVVVTAAEYGHGRRAGWLSDYTFAVRDGDVLRNVGEGVLRRDRRGDCPAYAVLSGAYVGGFRECPGGGTAFGTGSRLQQRHAFGSA